MRGTARKTWNVLGAALYFLFATICALSAVGLMIVANLTVFQKAYVIAVVAIAIVFLAAHAVGILRRKN